MNSITQIYTLTTPILAISVQLFSIGLFINAAMHKTLDYKGFVSVMAGYRIVPLTVVWQVSAIVIVTEFVTVLGLLFTIPILKSLAPALLVIYAIAIQINLKRGRTEIDCGCGGHSQPISQFLVLRNLFISGLLAWSIHTTGFSRITEYAIAYLALIAVAALGLVSLYLSCNQLCLNQSLQGNVVRGSS